ncbi:hypothetical protein AC249_AIPGENE15385 [Paramuricea clavata]|uniref:Uncharacterized protein n=1 Tax=Paramuricea clavata TaxID=317549 RepID=A0A7D9DSG8_PARCT|nr:hypothetical protein AC249_AIPGENE15385 [Paramuricea clavata]
MTVWMAYNNGPGKVLPLTNFCRPPTVPKLIHSEETEDTVSFVAVKARQQPKKSREQNNTDPMEDESNDERVDTYSKLFLCPEQGCIKSFHTYSSLERHLHCDNHTYGDFLTPQQIASFFSRLAKKRRENTAGDKDNEERGDGDDNDYEEDDLNKKDFEKRKGQEIEELSASLIDAIGLKHPIMFDRHNICELTNQRKLSKFSVYMLQEICSSFELNITDSTGKRKFKKPYIDLLEKLVQSCGC